MSDDDRCVCGDPTCEPPVTLALVEGALTTLLDDAALAYYNAGHGVPEVREAFLKLCAMLDAEAVLSVKFLDIMRRAE